MKRVVTIICAALLAGPAVYATVQRGGNDTIQSIRAKKPKKLAVAAPTKSVMRNKPATRTHVTRSAHTASRQKPVTSKSATLVKSGPMPTAPKPPPAPAARTVYADGLSWTVKGGTGAITVNSDGIRVSPGGPRDTVDYVSASARLGLGATPLWRVGFDVRFGELLSTGSCVKLASRDRLVGTIGADGPTKSMTAAITSSAGPKFAKPADRDWVTCEFLGTQRGVSVFVNGMKVGEGAIDAAPDALTVGPMTAAAGRQSEIEVRDLSVASANDPVRPMELFNGKNLAGWAPGPLPWAVQDGVLRNKGGGQFDWVKYEIPIQADAFTLTLRVRVVDGIRFRFFVAHGPTLLAHLAGQLVEFFSSDGRTRNLKLIGTGLANIKSMGKTGYQTGEWREVRYEVNEQGYTALFLDGELISSATRVRGEPLNIALCPSDNFSQGHIEVTSVQLTVSQ